MKVLWVIKILHTIVYNLHLPLLSTRYLFFFKYPVNSDGATVGGIEVAEERTLGSVAGLCTPVIASAPATAVAVLVE